MKGSDRNFEAAQTERYRKTKKDRRERRETSGGDPKIRGRGRGSSTSAPGSGPRIAFAKNLRGEGSRNSITAQLTRILNLPFQLQNDLFLGEVARRRSGGDYDITRRVRWKGNDRCVSTGPQGLPLSDCC